MATYVFDEFVFDDIRYALSRSGKPIKADTQVLEMLAYLLRNPGRLVTKEELIEEVWQGRVLGDNVISVCVAKLRKALGGASSSCVGNVYGRGYRFMRSVVRHEAPAPPAAATSTAPLAEVPQVSAAREAPLVGRNNILTRLESALLQAKQGRGSVCALLGEAGIGKTRLSEALETHAQRAGFAVSWGHCHRLGDVPALWPFLKLMRTWNLPLEAADEAAATSGGDPGDESWDDKSADSWRRTLLATTDAIEKRASAQPQLIMLEDVHWADAASLKLLSHLVSTVTQHKLLIVLTVRDTQLPEDGRRRRVLDHILGHRDCTRLALTRLSRADIDAYVQTLLGNLDARVAEVVFNKSQGNPFFMVELLRPFADGRTPRAEDLRLPEPALDIVRQLLEHTGDKSRDVLAAASVIGRGFDLGVLSQVTEEKPEQLLELLEPAMIGQVIVPQRDSHARFEFGHDLIREVLYQDLPSVMRMRLHARVGNALALRATTDASVSSAEVAHHLLAGLPSSDVNEALLSARSAAVAASRIGAYADASMLLRRALDALTLHPEAGRQAACELLFDLARFERAAGEPYAQHLEQAVALAREQGHRRVLVSAGQLVCGPPGTVSVEGAGDVLETALSALPEDAHSERAMLLSHLSWTPPHSWHKDKVEALLGQAEELSRTARPSAVRTMLRARLYYTSGPDNLERAHALCQTLENMEASRNARQRARWALEPQLAQLVSHLQQGDLNLARRAADAFGSAARELHHAELIWHYERMLVILRMNAGELGYAAAALKELKLRAEQLQLHARKTVEAVDFGELATQTIGLPKGQPGSATAWRPRPSDGPLTYAAKLRAMCQLGFVEEARAELAAFQLERLHNVPKSRDYLATLGHLAYACVETHSKRQAAAVYELLAPYPHLCVATLSLHAYGPVARSLGQLAGVLGDRERAAAHYETALADAERFGLLPQLALTRYQYAELLHKGAGAEATDRARRLLDDASALTQRLGMHALHAQTLQLAAAVG